MKLFHLIKSKLNNKLHQNIFKTNFDRNVLVSYINNPIYLKNNFYHTNTQECAVIIEVLRQLKFNVDLCNFNFKKSEIDYEKYNLVFGFGAHLINAKKNNPNIISIYYATGLFVPLNDFYSLSKLKKIYNNNSKLINSLRLASRNYYDEDKNANFVIYLNNKINKKIYNNILKKKSFSINVTFNFIKTREDLLKKIKNKNIDQSKRNIIYFSGPGCIHKGLDTVLNFFEKEKKFNLYLFQSFRTEREFFKIYKLKIKNNCNIFHYDNIPINSLKFESIVNNSLFTILPSVAEGQPSSLVNLSSMGLIPLISKQSGIEINANFFSFDLNKSRSLNYLINKISKYDSSYLKKLSIENVNLAFKYHSLDQYKINMKKILQKIIY